MSSTAPARNDIARLAITPGEPAGIGPDLCVQLAQDAYPAELIAVADPEILAARARLLDLPLELVPFVADTPAQPHRPGRLPVRSVASAVPVRPGHPDVANARYVLACLDAAVDGCRDGRFDALITGPVNKAVINDAGIPFTGHTEYLAERCATPRVVMMLATAGLRVALATTHLPLAAVSAALNRDDLAAILRILIADLRARFGIARPRILVCGLNPHAGEGGHLGHEETDVIAPVLEQLRSAEPHIELLGPLPADTLFTPKYLERADAVLAMYHDQGLPVLKYKGFGRAVNITLGLPIVRTSVDHGTALELAGSGSADIGSLRVALDTAREMLRHAD